MDRPKVVVVGAGYAGMAFLKHLGEPFFQCADVTVITKTPDHYHTAMLHKVAVGEASGQVLFNVRDCVRPEVKVVVDTVTDILPERKCVETASGVYAYDYLVCAVGFEVEDFKTPGMEHAFFIDSYESVSRLAKTFNSNVESAIKEKRDLSIVVCGGGQTGVEYAASCKKALDAMLEGFSVDENDRARFSVTVVNAISQLLPTMSKHLAQRAQDYLEQIGVKVLNDTFVTGLEVNAVLVRDGDPIPADLIVWCAGVKGPSLIGTSQFGGPKNRVAVNGELENPEWPGTFFIGDVSSVLDANGVPFAPTAQVAAQEGAFLARVLEARVAKKPFKETFGFESKGSICSLGRDFAVADVFGMELVGWLPSRLKLLTEKKWNVTLLGVKGLFR